MPIFLLSEPTLLMRRAAALEADGLIVLLADGASAHAEALEAAVDTPLLIDINGTQLSRVNFDAVALVILDLTPEVLLSAAGRRLVDALGRLAQDGLSLAFIGSAVGVTGLFLEDGVTAGLNLVAKSVVIPAVQEVPDLQALLRRVSEQGVRLLALDTPVGATYDMRDDTVAVTGAGSVLLVSFTAAEDGERATARLHALTNGMRDTWPA